MSDSDSPECSFGKSYGNNSCPYDTCLNAMLKESFLCDVTIRVCDYTKSAHRIILSAASCFFCELLKNVKPLGQDLQEFDLTNVFIKPENFDLILHYIYNGYINLNDKNVISLLEVNKVLVIESLNKQCAQFLLSKLRPLNGLETWEIAWKYNLHELSNISLILCRETLCDLLLINNDNINLSEGFLSLFIVNKEVVASVKPESVVRMLLRWTSAQQLENTDKRDKFFSLLGTYLDWRSLSELEFEIMKLTIRRCSFDFPELTSNALTWLSNRYKMQVAQLFDVQQFDEEAADEISHNPHPLSFRQNWSLLVAEKDFQTVGIYCNSKSTWFTMELEDNPLKALGFISNSLLFVRDFNTVLLRDIDTMSSQILQSPILSDLNFVKCTGALHPTFFSHLNNIYSVDALTHSGKKDLVCLISRWDPEISEWISVLHLKPDFASNDVLSVSLKVETSYGDDVYLFITVKRLHVNRPSPRLNLKREESTYGTTASAFSGNFATSLTENSAICMKPLEMFYVFRINLKDFSYRQIGERRSEPANLNLNRKIILDDRIIFLLDPDRDIESKFCYAYYYKNDCLLNCLSLFFDDENSWTNMTLRAPLPDIRDISIRKRDRACLDSFVTTCKNLLFVGTHWSPHIFQVFMYDISNFTVSTLPAIPLPAIRPMSIYALHVHQPISDFLTEETRTVDLLSFHFKDWSLLSWEGAVV